MGFHDRYHTDKAAEEEGTWQDFGDGVKIKLRRPNSAHTQARRKALEEPFRAAQKFGQELSADDQQEVMTQLLSQSVIVDWKGVEVPDGTDENGQAKFRAVPAVPEEIAAVLKRYPDFRNEVVAVVADRATFKAQVRDDDVKN